MKKEKMQSLTEGSKFLMRVIKGITQEIVFSRDFFVDRMIDKKYEELGAKTSAEKAQILLETKLTWMEEYCSQHNISTKAGKGKVENEVKYLHELTSANAEMERLLDKLTQY